MRRLEKISPSGFEKEVRNVLSLAGRRLKSFKTAHQESLQGSDGDYTFDVTATFEALGADFLVLIECKHEKRKVERQDVQVLHAKVTSAGAQKGMLFSVAGFQQGAIEYADVHGIALVQLASGSSSWFTKGAGSSTPPPPWANIPEYVGWWCHGDSMSIMSSEIGEYTLKALGVSTSEP